MGMRRVPEKIPISMRVAIWVVSSIAIAARQLKICPGPITSVFRIVTSAAAITPASKMSGLIKSPRAT